jgi:uncharacterized protein (DUF2062 family)
MGGHATDPAALDQLSWDMMLAFGGPIMLGMGLFAVGTALLGYVLVKAFWTLRVVLARRQRRGAKA